MLIQYNNGKCTEYTTKPISMHYKCSYIDTNVEHKHIFHIDAQTNVFFTQTDVGIPPYIKTCVLLKHIFNIAFNGHRLLCSTYKENGTFNYVHAYSIFLPKAFKFNCMYINKHNLRYTYPKRKKKQL